MPCGLIRDLLDVSTIEAGGFAITPAKVDIGAILREAVESFEELAREKGIALSCHSPETLPPALGDSARLVRVLSNLIDNALKFTPEGGQVSLEAQRHPNQIHVCVRDTGSGIPAEALPRIFDRFWRAHRTARAGAGLGLAIAKGIVEAHGGRIWATSKPGEGTTICFSVPAAPAASAGRD